MEDESRKVSKHINDVMTHLKSSLEYQVKFNTKYGVYEAVKSDFVHTTMNSLTMFYSIRYRVEDYLWEWIRADVG